MKPTFSRGRFALIAALLNLLIFAVQLTTAAPVGVSVGTVQARTGQHLSVPISLNGASNIASMQFELVYDPAVLQFDKLESGSLASDNCLMETNGKEPGRLRTALVSQSGISNDGILALAHFKAVGQSGATSTLTLRNVRAWQIPKGHENMHGMNHLIDVNATIESGQVTLQSPFPIWLWFAIGAAVVLVLLYVTFRGRSRSPAQTVSQP